MRTRFIQSALLCGAVAGTLATTLALTPAVAQSQARTSGSAMILYGHTPTLEFGGDSYSGAVLSVAGDLALGGRWVGRVQADMLQAASLSGPNADNVESGLSLIGSLGYRFQFASLPRLSLDLLAHAGYAQVTYDSQGSDFTDASPQIGVGIAPHVRLTNRLGLTFAVRTLQGAEVGEGTAINRTDISVGGRLTLF